MKMGDIKAFVKKHKVAFITGASGIIGVGIGALLMHYIDDADRIDAENLLKTSEDWLEYCLKHTYREALIRYDTAMEALDPESFNKFVNSGLRVKIPDFKLDIIKGTCEGVFNSKGD